MGNGRAEDARSNKVRIRWPGRHGSWMRGLRWFGAEFLVVVSGVLMALALNAFYQGRVDAVREAGYLEQLEADLQESYEELETALEANRIEKIKMLDLLSLFNAEEVPSAEEFRKFTTLSVHPAEPTLSTAQAIVETGDLHLIRDDSLRSAIIQYVGAGESYVENQDIIAWQWVASSIREYYQIVRPGLRPGHPLATSPHESFAREALYDIAYDLQVGYSNQIREQKSMLADIRQVQAEIDRSFGET